MGALLRTAVRSWAPLRVLRARQWIHFVVLPLAGGREMAPLGVAALLLAYAYGLNAISDRATDLDERKNPLVGGGDWRAAMALVLAAGAAGLAGAMLAGRIAWAAAAISLLSATVYSVGPRIKRVPVVGTLANLGIFAPLLWLGRARPPLVEAVAFAVLLLQNQLLHERADALEDEVARVRSTACTLGVRGTMIVFALLAAGGVAWVLPNVLAALAIAMASGLPLVVREAGERRLLHRWLAVAAGAAIFVGVGA